MLVDDMVAAHVNATIDDEPVTRRYLVNLAEERLLEDTTATDRALLERREWEAKAQAVKQAAAEGVEVETRVIDMSGGAE